MIDQLPPCYWEGRRPCSHDRGRPLPKPKPLSSPGWPSRGATIEGQRWDGAPLESPSSLAQQRSHHRRRTA